MGGRGTFENNYVINATASILPTLLTMWVPETLLVIYFPHLAATALGGIKIIPVWADVARQAAGIIWPMFIAVIGIKIAENVNTIKSITNNVIFFFGMYRDHVNIYPVNCGEILRGSVSR